MGRSNAWSNGRELVESLRVTELPARDGGRDLEVAGGDVVADGEAEDVVERVGGGDVLGVPANDDGEFAFVVELGLQIALDVEVGEGAGDGVRAFGEDGGISGDLELFRVLVSGGCLVLKILVCGRTFASFAWCW